MVIVSYGALIPLLSVYVGIPESGIMGTILIFLSTMVWGLTGGLTAATYSIINLGLYISKSPRSIDPSFMILGTFLYLFIGIALGRLLDVIRDQKAHLVKLLESLEQKEIKYHYLFDSIVDGLFVFEISYVYGEVKILSVNSIVYLATQISNIWQIKIPAPQLRLMI